MIGQVRYNIREKYPQKEGYVRPFVLKPRFSVVGSSSDFVVLRQQSITGLDGSRSILREREVKNVASFSDVPTSPAKLEPMLKFRDRSAGGRTRKRGIEKRLKSTICWTKSVWSSSIPQVEILRSLAISRISKSVPKFDKKIRQSNQPNNYIKNFISFGSPIPYNIKSAMSHLYGHAQTLRLIFRKTGSSDKEKELFDKTVNSEFFSVHQVDCYVLGGFISKYLRNTPDCLFTAEFTDLLVNYYDNYTPEGKLEFLRDLVTLLPETNKEVMVLWIRLLKKISVYEDETQMSPYNLAVCLCGTVFSRNEAKTRISSSKNALNRLSVEMTRQTLLIRCFEDLITNYHKIFEMGDSGRIFRLVRGDDLKMMATRLISDLYRNVNFYDFDEETMGAGQGVEVMSRPFEGSILRIWKCSTLVKCHPWKVIEAIFKEKVGWFFLGDFTAEEVNSDTQIVTFREDWVVERICCMLWHKEIFEGNAVLVGKSLEVAEGEGCAVVECPFFAYFVEPKGNFCRLSHFICVDTKGRSLKWHNTIFGSRLAVSMANLRNKLEIL